MQIQHIEEHFERGEDGSTSGMTAAQREAQKTREEHEFQLLRVNYTNLCSFLFLCNLYVRVMSNTNT